MPPVNQLYIIYRTLLNLLFSAASQTILLEDALGKDNFRLLKNKIYSKTQSGFYVRAKPNKSPNINKGIQYVVRYTGRPVMAQSRIINYDGENITFYYQRHEDNQRVKETVYAFDFIKKLIIHIPDTEFRMIGYSLCLGV